MARNPRVEFEGAFYHVIARGNQRQKIFRDDRDRSYDLKRVEHYRQRYQFSIYVLMSNHVHLLLETGKTPPGTKQFFVTGMFTFWSWSTTFT